MGNGNCAHVVPEDLDWRQDNDFSCGVFGCAYLTCDDCYDGHLLECHLFNGELYEAIPFRVSGTYNTHTQKRGRRAKELILGPKP